MTTIRIRRPGPVLTVVVLYSEWKNKKCRYQAWCMQGTYMLYRYVREVSGVLQVCAVPLQPQL